MMPRLIFSPHRHHTQAYAHKYSKVSVRNGSAVDKDASLSCVDVPIVQTSGHIEIIMCIPYGISVLLRPDRVKINSPLHAIPERMETGDHIHY